MSNGDTYWIDLRQSHRNPTWAPADAQAGFHVRPPESKATMARIITELIDEREIPKYFSGVADIEAEGELDDIEIDPDGWVGTDDDGIAIDGGDSERYLIKYELWDGPPPPSEAWERSWSGSVRLTSGKVHAVNEYSGDAFYGTEFDLGRKDCVWQVRVHRNLLDHKVFTSALIGVTLINIQFWLDD